MELQAEVKAAVEAHLGSPVRLLDAEPRAGGSINDAWELRTSQGRYFLKTNAADRHPSRFEAEVQDLRLLASAKALRTPGIIAHGEAGDTAYLLMEFMPTVAWTDAADRALATGLARQHRETRPRFGLDRDNWIGTVAQSNTEQADWPGFLVDRRLAPLVRKARDLGRIGDGDAIRAERVFAKLPELLPMEAPALLHGDLWHGNALATPEGVAVVDPAAYFGHREMDIAMAGLFGGIGPGFYRAYEEAWPLAPGWEGRMDLYRLYPLLVHAILFGGAYRERVSTVLKAYA